MSEFNWEEILITEDRIISNSNRKHRAHFISFEIISEEWLYHLSSEENFEDMPDLSNMSYIDSIENRILAEALRTLTPKQSQVIELIFWKGYKGFEVANLMNCSCANVSILLNKALQKIKDFLENR